MAETQKIVILNFGGQYTQLIGERCAGDRKTVGRVVIGGECVFRDSAAPVSVMH